MLKVSRHTLLYGAAMAALLLLLKWLEYRYILYDYAFEVYAGAIAILFTGLGIWVARSIATPKTSIQQVFIEKQPEPVPEIFARDEAKLEQYGISKREMEVLELMALGLSNQEIADRLFVSLNTVKTHISNLFVKLDVSRRTQAVKAAKELKLIA